MARRGGEGGGGGPMGAVIAGFVGTLVIVSIMILAPTLAGTMQASTPALGVTSAWNSTYNTALPTGASLWQTTTGLGVVAIIVYWIALAVFYIKGLI
jgi:hypothetical protein